MNKRYLIILGVVLATTAFGQNANPRLRQLEKYLQQHSHGIEFTQKSDGDGDVWYSWRAQIDTVAMSPSQYEDAIDSIRTAFASVRKDAAESYTGSSGRTKSW